VQAAEKVFQSYRLTVRNAGGHSSLPEKNNAIYRLAAALQRVGAYDFPFETNGVTRAYFSRSAALNTGALADEMRGVSAREKPDSAAATRLAARSPFYNAQLRTTCVATMLEGGHAVNALPQRASALVNCRILPGVDVASVQRTLRAVIGDTAVDLTRADTARPSPPSVLPAAVESVISSVTASLWGTLPVVPNMETGATDGLFLRNAGIPVYGVSGYFADPNKPDDNRAHGLNERISVKGYYDQIEFTYRLLKGL
jgi:acetylornithine deacetylase/succinyl-diaminopimelate desuccinylase-like protein